MGFHDKHWHAKMQSCNPTGINNLPALIDAPGKWKVDLYHQALQQCLAPRQHIWYEIALSCRDGISEHTFDSGHCWLMTCTASLFKAHNIWGPTARRGPKILFWKPEFHVTLMGGAVYEEGRWFPPVVSLSFCCAPLHSSSQSGPSGEGGRWRDRRVVGWCHLDWSPAPSPEYDNVHTWLWCRQIIFLIPSSCSPFQRAILPCVFFFLF